MLAEIHICRYMYTSCIYTTLHMWNHTCAHATDAMHMCMYYTHITTHQRQRSCPADFMAFFPILMSSPWRQQTSTTTSTTTTHYKHCINMPMGTLGRARQPGKQKQILWYMNWMTHAPINLLINNKHAPMTPVSSQNKHKSPTKIEWQREKWCIPQTKVDWNSFNNKHWYSHIMKINQHTKTQVDCTHQQIAWHKKVHKQQLIETFASTKWIVSITRQKRSRKSRGGKATQMLPTHSIASASILPASSSWPASMGLTPPWVRSIASAMHCQPPSSMPASASTCTWHSTTCVQVFIKKRIVQHVFKCLSNNTRKCL